VILTFKILVLFLSRVMCHVTGSTLLQIFNDLDFLINDRLKFTALVTIVAINMNVVAFCLLYYYYYYYYMVCE